MATGADGNKRTSVTKILAAAQVAFLRDGFLGTSMDRIAAEAVVSKQTVYAHFKSKEALFIEVVRSMTDTASIEIGEKARDDLAGRTAAEFLLQVANDQLATVLTPRLMQLRRMVIGEVERFPELGRALHAGGAQRSIDRIARALEHYAQIGELTVSDVRRAAAHFNWIVMGAPLNDAMLLGDTGLPSDAQLRDHAAEAVRIFLCAFGPCR